MRVFLRRYASILLTACLVAGLAFSPATFAAEKKDKAAKRAAQMMQKMKQEMAAERSALQAQMDSQQKTYEAQLLLKEDVLVKSGHQLQASEAKAMGLSAELKRIADEKMLLEKALTETRTALAETQHNLTQLNLQHSQALSELSFNDSQRKTQVANLADSTKQLNSCAAMNAQLHQFGTELIQLYDNPGLYSAVMRKEQFFQLKRVELENILQNQQDKLDSARFLPRKSAP